MSIVVSCSFCPGFKRLNLQIYTEYIQNNRGKLWTDKQGTCLHKRIKIDVQDCNENIR